MFESFLRVAGDTDIGTSPLPTSTPARALA
jgi:hypothetical protein